MYHRRISLLSCSQIPVPLPLILQSHISAARSARANPASTPIRVPSPSDENLVAGIWSPQCPAEHDEPRRTAYLDRDIDADVLNVWLCPEIDTQIRRERTRRRKALLIAERMGAMVQADRQQHEQQLLERREARRGRKRKASECAAAGQQGAGEPELPTSPELARPQSLLIPELLPKGMLRQRTGDADKAAGDKQPAQPPVLSQSYSDSNSSSEPLDLGLDLGFDIASDACDKQAGTSSAILEIADFLEKDIDIFSPTTMVSTPRSATMFGSKASRMDVDAVPVSKGRPQDLIEDILNFSL
ncbi:hypothetical protein GGF43_001066 [Coemansia sp. RSA 2618]|nr:hypothetical protein GGF43_001066 [Coemansia sp. RSA 2618]